MNDELFRAMLIADADEWQPTSAPASAVHHRHLLLEEVTRLKFDDSCLGDRSKAWMRVHSHVISGNAEPYNRHTGLGEVLFAFDELKAKVEKQKTIIGRYARHTLSCPQAIQYFGPNSPLCDCGFEEETR